MTKDKEITKTNAARLLDSVGIAYELIPYSYSEDDLSAQSVAAELGEDIDMVFKTLVLRGDKSGLFVCVIPGDFEVDLKTAARLSGNKSCEMVHVKELLSLTGYIRGGCSPIGMKKQYPTFVHESALLYDYIYISAGESIVIWHMLDCYGIYVKERLCFLYCNEPVKHVLSPLEV